MCVRVLMVFLTSVVLDEGKEYTRCESANKDQRVGAMSWLTANQIINCGRQSKQPENNKTTKELHRKPVLRVQPAHPQRAQPWSCNLTRICWRYFWLLPATGPAAGCPYGCGGGGYGWPGGGYWALCCGGGGRAVPGFPVMLLLSDAKKAISSGKWRGAGIGRREMRN